MSGNLVGLSKEDLIAIIEAARKPVLSDDEITKREADKKYREEMGELLKLAHANKKLEQQTCTHMRPNGSTPMVFIADLNKLYCQHCQKWTDPKEEPELFNRFLQLSTTGNF